MKVNYMGSFDCGAYYHNIDIQEKHYISNGYNQIKVRIDGKLQYKPKDYNNERYYDGVVSECIEDVLKLGSGYVFNKEQVESVKKVLNGLRINIIDGIYYINKGDI